MNRFLQIHTLTSYPASLLNRDDAGFAKRIPFGGTMRTRISSQCLKHHWREFDGPGALSDLGVPMSVRSRLTFEKLVLEPLVKDGVDRELARAVTQALMGAVLGKSEKAKKEAAKEVEEKQAKKRKKSDAHAAEAEAEEELEQDEGLQTGQITVLGRAEVDYLLSLARKACADQPEAGKAQKAVVDLLGKEGRDNLQKLGSAAGLDAALFGRMVTGDILARGDAALHVAHAFTVHEEASESDYFSAVDMLLKSGSDEKLGSGHIGSSELTSGLFYGYVVIDVPLLVSNLGGQDRKRLEKDRELAAKVVERIVKIIATVSPGAKLGSTAPHAYAQLVLIEAGNAQPRTLANAFLDPVSGRTGLLDAAYVALANHGADLDRMYESGLARNFAAMGKIDGLRDKLRMDAPVSVGALASWAADQVRGA